MEMPAFMASGMGCSGPTGFCEPGCGAADCWGCKDETECDSVAGNACSWMDFGDMGTGAMGGMPGGDPSIPPGPAPGGGDSGDDSDDGNVDCDGYCRTVPPRVKREPTELIL